MSDQVRPSPAPSAAGSSRPTLAALRQARASREALLRRILPIGFGALVIVVVATSRAKPGAGLHGASLGVTLALAGFALAAIGGFAALLVRRTEAWLLVPVLILLMVSSSVLPDQGRGRGRDSAGPARVAGGQAALDPAVQLHLVEAIADGVPSGPSPAPLPDGLTPREAEVLTLIAAGLSNAEIAERLVVSEATVKSHVNHMLAKIGARDRAQAVGYAFRHGLVPR